MKTAERYLALMAQRCRDAYIRERTNFELRKGHKPTSGKVRAYQPAARWDGGEDDEGYEHEPIWPKLAVFMIKHGLDPYSVVRKRFEIVRGSTPPWPNQIAVDTHLDLYTGDVESLSEEQVLLHFNLDKEYCRVGMSSARFNRPGMEPGFACKSLLLDTLMDISPLMRYSLAKELGLQAVMDTYRQAALSQYLRATKAYDKIWGPAIPQDIKDGAEEISSLVNQKHRRTNGPKQER